jgi:uncharacterized protein YutE (UPF0331/DUF86 family)
MVDPVRLARLLQRAGEQLAILEDRAAEDRGALREDEARLSGTKYRFVTAIEAVLDVAHHFLASELWGPAEDSGDAVRLLAAHGVIDAPLGDRCPARGTGSWDRTARAIRRPRSATQSTQAPLTFGALHR